MSDEFKIQCEVCGTLYNDLEEVCPYCGAPQPSPEPQSEEISIEAPYLAGDPEPLLAVDDPHLEEDDFLPEDAPPLEEDYLLGAEDYYPEEKATYPYGDHERVADDPLADDDIFAVGGEEGDDDFIAEDEYFEDDGLYAAYDDDDFEIEAVDEVEEEAKPRFYRRRRLLLGCLGTLICFTTFYGGIGLLAVYNGWQERTQEVLTEAEDHYRRGQEHLAAGSIELAIAELERALSLNPNLLAAREALRTAENISESRPTPTSETRSAAAASLLIQAEDEISQNNWLDALETLSQVRDLDPNYEAERVADLLFEIHYTQGLALVADKEVDEALLAFDQALVERPNDRSARAEQIKAALYLDGLAALEDDPEEAVAILSQLYNREPDYLDLVQLLPNAYEQFGDLLVEAKEWCLAEGQYVEATALGADDAALLAKARASGQRCKNSATPQVDETPTPPALTPPPVQKTVAVQTPADAVSVEATATLTATKPAATGSGSIFFSAYNPNESRWEILSTSFAGDPRVVVTNGTMPAVSPNGKLLLYRSEAIESEGFHIFDMTTGEDRRISILRQDMLPRWGGDDSQFLFVALEPGSDRWQVQLGFADGKGDPQILRDGRTPDLSPNNQLIAYQGTDPEGNNPGIYITPFGGGETRRITDHESDRVPVFSPNSAQVAYMSTRNGNWDIYIVNADGGSARQVTTYSGSDGLPVWSPDGSKIAYVSDQGGSWNIYIINATGGTPQKVTSWPSDQRADWLVAQISWGR